MLEPEVMVYQDEDYDCQLVGYRGGMYEPQESRKNGSVSLTMGKCRKFCMYTMWLPIASRESLSGNESKSHSSVWIAIMP